MTTCSPVGSTTVERGSMNAGMSRCWRYSRSMTMPPSRALAIASSTSPPLPCRRSRAARRRSCSCRAYGCARTASVAASLRSSTAGQLARSRRRRARRRRGPAAAVRATTTATISPVCATRSSGIGQVVGALLVGGDRPRRDVDALDVGDVRAGEHRDDPRGALGLGGVDGVDGRVGEGAADHREVQHARELDVVGPLRAAGDEPLVLLAPAGGPDLGARTVVDGGHRASVLSLDIEPAAAATALTMLW